MKNSPFKVLVLCLSAICLLAHNGAAEDIYISYNGEYLASEDNLHLTNEIRDVSDKAIQTFYNQFRNTALLSGCYDNNKKNIVLSRVEKMAYLIRMEVLTEGIPENPKLNITVTTQCDKSEETNSDQLLVVNLSDFVSQSDQVVSSTDRAAIHNHILLGLMTVLNNRIVGTAPCLCYVEKGKFLTQFVNTNAEENECLEAFQYHLKGVITVLEEDVALFTDN